MNKEDNTQKETIFDIDSTVAKNTFIMINNKKTIELSKIFYKIPLNFQLSE